MKLPAITIAALVAAATTSNAFVVPLSSITTATHSLSSSFLNLAPTASFASTTIPVEHLSSDYAIPHLVKKPKVLFFHGEYTNEKFAARLLKMMGYDQVFDFIMPPAMYEGTACPQELQDGLELGPLIKKGMYPLDGDYFKWGGRFEQMEQDPSSFKEEERASFQDDLRQYVTKLDEQYGPFDGIMGFCEGGAALNIAIAMAEQGKLNGALDSAKFFIHMAPWVTPLGGDYATMTKTMPTLTVAGTNDFDMFVRSNNKYSEGFTGYFDEYSHNGRHNYPVLNNKLRNKILSLVDKSTNGFLIEDWEYTIYDDDESSLLITLTEEQKATVVDLIAEVSRRDADDFAPQTTLTDELEMDSLDISEFFLLVVEELGFGDDFDTNANEMRIFGKMSDATVQNLLDEAALMIKSSEVLVPLQG